MFSIMLGVEKKVLERSEHREDTDNRLTRLELQAEREFAYNFVTVESSPALEDIFKRVNDGTFARSELHKEGARALVEEVATTLAKQCDETTLQNTEQ